MFAKEEKRPFQHLPPKTRLEKVYLKPACTRSHSCTCSKQQSVPSSVLLPAIGRIRQNSLLMDKKTHQYLNHNSLNKRLSTRI